ncbi:MAG: DNA polymerase IV [Nitrososphaerota archaeon]|jgi:DNA polymerase IV (DinB-like DNA polymerase)|uniref:DNA polymerase IV n=1 Tax=Candidatus Bathycorpusculum sp. TaxID=2994959 RepID=UPI002835EF0D|nr:DNA polymerase IV [Candidatus Termiticorpusculum sp.]MCL2258183.1 DNA polymerase IV [Candidatus Termiticorpusculum sp.]MCL2291492.1 DNA polymerase IV [Candidatus Termiticorpusculum sp.]MDR0460639.1 DNA polymerase IV [Nitrososphaerota archaeon]
MVQSRVVMLIDFDYFFAQCEELRNPVIKNKPVVVGVYSGRTEDSGAVSTSNYIARKYGVKSGIPLFLAKRSLEGTDAVFLPVDHKYYTQISDNIMQILSVYASSLEQVSVDEAYLDVTVQVSGSFENACLYAQKIKQDIKTQVGLSLTIGVGPNKLVAKIACDSQKPDGLTIVKPEEAANFFAILPVNRLLGVGKKTFARMEQMGIKTIGDLAKFDIQRLVSMFGKVLGLYFHNAANAIDNEPVVFTGEAESISKINTLKQDTRDLESILQKTSELIDIIHNEVMEKGYSFKTISIYVVTVDLLSKSRSVTLEQPVKAKEIIKRHVCLLFEKYLSESSLDIRRVGVRVSGFSKEQLQQKQLSSFFG